MLLTETSILIGQNFHLFSDAEIGYEEHWMLQRDVVLDFDNSEY